MNDRHRTRLTATYFIGIALLTAPGWCERSVRVWEGSVDIPTYPWGPLDPNPKFQAFTDLNIYPYPMEDVLNFNLENRTYKAFFLENEYLKVTVLPELGGHVHSVHNKINDTEMFYTNHVVKPGLIAQRGAWISGGIEFNTGPAGHTVTAVTPIDVRAIAHDDGSCSLAVGHVERIYRTQWAAIITLRPGKAYLEERIRLYNPTEYPQPYYFWNCTAVPNTEGMRFMYPMTLGTDHNGTVFFHWPVHEGVDLSLSKNYREPSSIFAYQCDRDFFGSYDYDLDRGLVAYADHRILPGKKAWTWGWGEVGRHSQKALTDTDGPYNEIQTGPLNTQADFDLIPPHGVIEWQEWWYPLHNMKGYEFATKDVAFNVVTENSQRSILIYPTGDYSDCSLLTTAGNETRTEQINLIAGKSQTVSISSLKSNIPWHIQLAFPNGEILAAFTYPLPLPVRTPPEAAAKPEQPSAHTTYLDGVMAVKRHDIPAARNAFMDALQLDARHTPSLTQSAILELEDGQWTSAASYAERAMAIDPDSGISHLACSEAMLALGHSERALDEAYRATRDIRTRSQAFAQIGRIQARRGQWQEAIEKLRHAVTTNGENLVARNRLALALLKRGDSPTAAQTAEMVLERDPLDRTAAVLLALAEPTARNLTIRDSVLRGDAQNTIETVYFLLDMRCPDDAFNVLDECYINQLNLDRLPDPHAPQRRMGPFTAEWATPVEPLAFYIAGYLNAVLDRPNEARQWFTIAKNYTPDFAFPHRLETLDILRTAVEFDAGDGQAWRMMGLLLAAHNRYEEARQAWSKAVACNPQDSVSYACLAQSYWKLDQDYANADAMMQKAITARPDDPVLYRDGARICVDGKDFTRARTLLETAVKLPIERYDCYEDLCRRYIEDGDTALALQLIEGKRFSNWEARRVIHELFVRAHLELAERALTAKEFQTVLHHAHAATTYPENLNVGRQDGANEARQYFLIGEAYHGLGQSAKAKESWEKAASFPREGESKEAQAAQSAARRLQ